MLGNKSSSKKQFLTKPKTTTSESVMKKYKSHEVYAVSNRKTGTSTTTSVTGPSKSTQKETQPTVKLSTVPEISKVSNKINSYISSKPRTASKVNIAGKLMNDESIQELDTEENGNLRDNIVDNSLDECDEKQLDEMRSTEMISNLCENIQAELPSTITEKGPKLINKLPKPFVKQNVTTVSPKKEGVKTKTENFEGPENMNRKLLISAKKGDRDSCLECLES